MEKLRSLPARPGGQGRWDRREGSAIRTATSPRAGTWLRRPQREPGHGTRGERSRRGRSGESARPSGGTQPFCGNGAGAGAGHPFPAPDRAFSLGDPFPPRHGAQRVAPSPPLGADGVRRAAGSGGAAPLTARRTPSASKQQQRQRREPARPGDGSAGGSEVSRRGNSAVSGGWSGMRSGGFPRAWAWISGRGVVTRAE